MVNFDISHDEVERILEQNILPRVIDSVQPEKQRRAVILGGQPGSGKSSLATHILSSEQNVVFINGDDLRVYHPKYYQYLSENDREAADQTQPVCNFWIESLIDICAARNLSIMIEGTMRRKEVPYNTAHMLREKGYSVTLAVVSVPYELSLLSLTYRYEELKKRGMPARFTKKESHDEAFNNIENTLEELVSSDLFDEFRVYKRHLHDFIRETFDQEHREGVIQAFKEGRLRPIHEKEREFFNSRKSFPQEFRIKNP